MVNYHIEVCIDNIESLHQAIAGGATRIELCSSLALGGLTPSFGFMRQAAAHSPIPVYAMIRPRQGDFFYTEEEVEIMMWDIEMAQRAGLQGVVLGLLNPDGSIDRKRTQRLCQHATALGLGITFHRAFDQCSEPKQALEEIITLGCERILTSGLAPSAPQGAALLASLVEQAAGRIAIMAGAGVNASNVKELVAKSHVTEVHLSGKGVRPSKMHFIAEQSKMGAADVDDFMIPLTDIEAIAKTVSALK